MEERGTRMTDQILEALGIRLLEQDLKSNRYNKDYCRTMLKAGLHFCKWAEAHGGLSGIQRKDIVRYQTVLGTAANAYTGKPYAASTIKQRYEAVKKICSLLYRAGALAENPTHGLTLRLPGERRAFKRRPLSREEITTFLESITPDDRRGLRNRAFFELVYSSGLRMSEAVHLKIGSISFDQRELVVRGKYDRDRVVPLSDVARDFLVQHVGTRKDNLEEYVFSGNVAGSAIRRTSMSRIFRELLARCGIDKPELCTHSIRHSTATHLLDNGAGVRQVQELLGHKSIESTVLYTHVQTEGLARIFRKYHPREHELFEILDKTYTERLESILHDHHGRLLTGSRLPRQKKKLAGT